MTMSPEAAILSSQRCQAQQCIKAAPVSARVRGRVMNLCLGHYDALALARAQAFCKRENLQTVDEMRAWTKARIDGIGKVTPEKHWQSVLNDEHAPARAKQWAADFFRHSVRATREPGED